MDWEELADESTEDLITYIQWKDEEEEEYQELAKAAFRAFCARFTKPVVHVSRKVCRNWGYDKDVADDIAHEAFERFWKYPNFDADKANKDNIDEAVKSYLYAIAQNLLIDYAKRVSGDTSPYDGRERIIREFPDVSAITTDVEKKQELEEKQKIIERALGRLSWKHKVIFLTYKAYEKEGHKLPRELLKRLREELNVGQATIRHYKREANEKVDEYLEHHGK